MAIFRCKACGAQLNVEPGSKVVTCEYCGSMQTVPDADDEKKINLYNRARLLMYRNDFDKAIVAYQSIISSYPDDAEAHWGVCVSKYGIEYVDDPRTGDKVPTCHRTLYESILDDPDYKEAIEKADVVVRDLYIAEAKEIDRIQKRIIKISQKEEPYDIFICYKETDESGNRTQDSVYAQDIYDKLTDKGYKVFFARITLENKLGQEYEPIIFAALRSSKLMLVVGTKQEYFEAVWVKNEWSRFLAFMSDSKDKYLIPCYKDIDAYDMPEEFLPLQSQDMNKIGYLQDLTRGIDKLFGRDKKQTVHVAADGAGLDAYYARVELNLNGGEFEKASWLIESIWSMDPKNARAHYYKFFIEHKIPYLRAKKLPTDHLPQNLFEDKDFKEAYDLADDKFKSELDEIIECHKESILSEKYDAAMQLAERHEFDEAIQRFILLGDFRDSKAKIDEVKESKNNYINSMAEECLKQDDFYGAIDWYEKLDNAEEKINAVKEARDKKKRRATLFKNANDLRAQINALIRSNNIDAGTLNLKDATSMRLQRLENGKKVHFGFLIGLVSVVLAALVFAVIGLIQADFDFRFYWIIKLVFASAALLPIVIFLLVNIFKKRPGYSPALVAVALGVLAIGGIVLLSLYGYVELSGWVWVVSLVLYCVSIVVSIAVLVLTIVIRKKSLACKNYQIKREIVSKRYAENKAKIENLRNRLDALFDGFPEEKEEYFNPSNDTSKQASTPSTATSSKQYAARRVAAMHRRHTTGGKLFRAGTTLAFFASLFAIIGNLAWFIGEGRIGLAILFALTAFISLIISIVGLTAKNADNPMHIIIRVIFTLIQFIIWIVIMSHLYDASILVHIFSAFAFVFSVPSVPLTAVGTKLSR